MLQPSNLLSRSLLGPLPFVNLSPVLGSAGGEIRHSAPDAGSLMLCVGKQTTSLSLAAKLFLV